MSSLSIVHFKMAGPQPNAIHQCVFHLGALEDKGVLRLPTTGRTVAKEGVTPRASLVGKGLGVGSGPPLDDRRILH